MKAGDVRACRLLVADTPGRDQFQNLLEALQREFGPPIQARGSQVMVRFGDPRAAWENSVAPAQRWAYAPNDAKSWYRRVIEGAAKGAGGGGPRTDPQRCALAAAVMIDDPTLPALILAVEVHFTANDGQPLSRRDLYMAKWSLQDWLREVVRGSEAINHPAPVTVAHFDCQLPENYDLLTQQIWALEENRRVGGTRKQLEPFVNSIAEKLPFGMGDQGNEYSSHFLGYTNLHTSMGEWGFMTGSGQRSWLIQDFSESDHAKQFFIMHEKPEAVRFLHLEMPGALYHIQAESFLWPLLAERWLLSWVRDARQLEYDVGAILEQMRDAEPQDVVRVLQADASKSLAAAASLRYTRQVIHRRTMPGARRLQQPADAGRPEVAAHPGFPSGNPEPRVLIGLGYDLQRLLDECDEIQTRLDEDLRAATVALSTSAQVHFASNQDRAARAMKTLTMVMLALTVITTMATILLLRGSNP